MKTWGCYTPFSSSSLSCDMGIVTGILCPCEFRHVFWKESTSHWHCFPVLHMPAPCCLKLVDKETSFRQSWACYWEQSLLGKVGGRVKGKWLGLDKNGPVNSQAWMEDGFRGCYPLILNCLFPIDLGRGEVMAFSYETTGHPTRHQHTLLIQWTYS